MDEHRLAEIEARLKAATRAPWEWRLTQHGSVQGKHFRQVRLVGAKGGGRVGMIDVCDKADLQLIVHAPEDLADLVAEVRSLWATQEAIWEDEQCRDLTALSSGATA